MTSPARRSPLAAVAAFSAVYDGALGIVMLFAAPWFAGTFGVAPAVPPVQANLNGLFLLAVAVGYWMPYRDPDRYRGYMWVMGPLLKGGGAALFLFDYVVRHSPESFLLFAASDGVLALVTLWALRATDGRRTST